MVGAMVGIVGFLIAPMGLSVGLIKFFSPLLVGGVQLVSQYVHQISSGATGSDTTSFFVAGLTSNIVVYAILGANVHAWMMSPNKSWILRTGA